MNGYEEAARERKANRIFVVLLAHGVDSEEAGFLSEQAWEALAHLAGVNPPSWRTKALVVSLLAQHAEAQQRMAAIMDPFDGLETV